MDGLNFPAPARASSSEDVRLEDIKPGKKKRILFLVPPGSIATEFGRLASAGAELPWLGMAYVAAAARKVGHSVLVRDYEVENRGWDSLARDIRSLKPDIIATAGFINNMNRCMKVFRIAKNLHPGIITVLGGPQATIFPEEAMRSADLDFITISESEISFSRLASHVEDPEAWTSFRGVIFRDRRTGDIVRNDPQPLARDLDAFPLPALDLYPMHRYYPSVYIRGKRVANLVTSRGCPHSCTFCEAKMTFGRTFRTHSEDRVLDDCDHLYRQFGYSSFQFYDDIFTVNRNRVIRLCEALLKKNRKYQWMCYTRADRVDRELLSLMRRAGCYMISFGIEAADQVLLDKIRKDLTVETNIKGIEACTEAGILAIGTFMLGLPTETPRQTMNTIAFARNSRLDYAIFGITEPYPGTEMWKDALREGYFVEAGGAHFNRLLPNFNSIWVPNGRTRDELESLNRLAYRRFYLRPRIFLRWMKNFLHIPIGRSFRYLRSGFDYLVYYPAVDAFKRLNRRVAALFGKKPDDPGSGKPLDRRVGVKYG